MWRVVVLWAVLAVGTVAQTGPAELLAEADVLYDRWEGDFDFAAYAEDLEAAIRLWEEVLPEISDPVLRREVLVKLSRAWFELAEAYLPEGEREQIYARGKDYALTALRLDSDFREREEREGFRAALAQAMDAEALFWYGNNFGRWLAYHWWEALTGGTRDVLTCFARAVELDEAYWGGGPHRALANFLAQTPGFLGGDRKLAKSEFLRAIELDPSFLQNYVDFAEHWAKPEGESALFCQLLEEALRLGADPETFGRWPLYNTLALARIQDLVGSCTTHR